MAYKPPPRPASPPFLPSSLPPERTRGRGGEQALGPARNAAASEPLTVARLAKRVVGGGKVEPRRVQVHHCNACHRGPKAVTGHDHRACVEAVERHFDVGRERQVCLVKALGHATAGAAGPGPVGLECALRPQRRRDGGTESVNSLTTQGGGEFSECLLRAAAALSHLQVGNPVLDLGRPRSPEGHNRAAVFQLADKRLKVHRAVLHDCDGPWNLRGRPKRTAGVHAHARSAVASPRTYGRSAGRGTRRERGRAGARVGLAHRRERPGAGAPAGPRLERRRITVGGPSEVDELLGVRKGEGGAGNCNKNQTAMKC